MIKSFRHKGVERFFKTGSKAKIQPHHADKLKLQLAALDNAKSPKDMNAPGGGCIPCAAISKTTGRWMSAVTGV